MIIPYRSRRYAPKINIQDQPNIDQEADSVLGRRPRPDDLLESNDEQVKRPKVEEDPDGKALARMENFGELPNAPADQDDQS